MGSLFRFLGSHSDGFVLFKDWEVSFYCFMSYVSNVLGEVSILTYFCVHVVCTNKAGNQVIDMFVAGYPTVCRESIALGKYHLSLHFQNYVSCLFILSYVIFICFLLLGLFISVCIYLCL